MSCENFVFQMFAVFCFEKESTVEVVPQDWCPTDSSCYWPPSNMQNQITFLISKCSVHDPKTWVLYSGKTLHKTSKYNFSLVLKSLLLKPILQRPIAKPGSY